jgi:hypothetical protein
MRSLFVLSVLIITASLATAQVFTRDADDLLEWNEYYHLQWTDFQGTASRNSFGDAGTAVLIKARPFYIKGHVSYDVFAYFNRKKSWCRGKSESLLSHERLHFDIAELYARMIRKKISDMNAAGVRDINQYNKAIEILLEKSNEADKQYDLETLHGTLWKKQAYWQKNVEEQLQGYKDFRKRKRLITSAKKHHGQSILFSEKFFFDRNQS